jgi:hypothetical protein
MGIILIRQKNDLLIVKVAGGASAQCLALMNAIFLKNKFSRKFKFQYYPYSTGTYWPLAIDFLLSDSEKSEIQGLTRGLDLSQPLEIGKIIKSHPLMKKSINYEKFLSLLRHLKCDGFLRRFRGEFTLEASRKRLDRVPSFAKSVSGGYVPIIDQGVRIEMDARFKAAGFKSPFSGDKSPHNLKKVVIHYRIGDKRAKFSHHKDFGGDGIVDPITFANLIIKENQQLGQVYVVSDEPEIAFGLLKSAGIKAKLNFIQNDLWEDIYLISQSDLFLGSWSQVSQLGALCCIGNGGRALLPRTTQVGTKISWDISEIEYYDPIFLDENHPIYDPNFKLQSTAHKVYKNKNK